MAVAMDTASDLDIFYYAFGMPREAIWSVSPQMKRAMLKSN
jgi:hypothetical protein